MKLTQIAAVSTLLASLAAAQNVGAVYTQTNNAQGNEVVWFNRTPGGVLGEAQTVSTGGLGLGSGLGSQGAVMLTQDKRFLLVVNAGSNDVSVFSIAPTGLTLVDREASRGVQPTSVCERNGVVYVLNAGMNSNVAGFTLAYNGDLVPLAAMPAALSSANPAPAQVAIGPGGGQVFVTERATNLIDVFPINLLGGLGAPTFVTSEGVTPFGFGIGKHDTLIVSEAAGGATDASTVSAYRIGQGMLTTITSAMPTTETAACWIIVSKNGRYAYTTNTGSGTLTGYFVAPMTGALTRMDFDGVTGDLGAGANPLDGAVSNDGRFMYVLSPATHEIATFRIRPDGSLDKRQSAFGLPNGVFGLAAR